MQPHPGFAAQVAWDDQVRNAEVLRRDGRPREAEKILVGLVKNAGLHETGLAFVLNELGGLYLETGRYAEAEKQFLRSLTVWEQQPDVNEAGRLSTLNNMIGLYTERGELERAERLSERVINTMAKQYPLQRAQALHSFAVIQYRRNRVGRAESLLREALASLEQHGFAEHPDAVWVQASLAGLLVQTGRAEEALACAQHALRTGEKTLGVGHSSLSCVLIAEASAYRATGRTAEAEASIQKALARLPAGFSVPLTDAWEEYARILRQAGRKAEAKSAEKRARQMREELELESRHVVDVSAFTRR
jgi:tetratricopeptide (TPR) repeat protein